MRIISTIWIGLAVSFMKDGVMLPCIVLHWACLKTRAKSIGGAIFNNLSAQVADLVLGSEISDINTSHSSTVPTHPNAKVAKQEDSQMESSG